ncbi:class I SAM-dependent methyltransferase [Candidatus Collierbacteria bacterium]|nr:class I SAM-dependent methyltransferase [Candidatus Collierbacteria bacterium]
MKNTFSRVKQTYDEIGLSFSATRRKLSPEVVSLLPVLPKKTSVLDLGCGNGVLLTALPKTVAYTGVDFSAVLIKEATLTTGFDPVAKFILADILEQSVWDGLGEFDLITALAVFHHLPTPNDHIKLLRNIKQHLNSTGTALISIWRLDQPKFDKFRINEKHLSIPFHSGPSRDFYSFTDDELTKLAQQAGFSDIKSTIIGDNLYLTLKK